MNSFCEISETSNHPHPCPSRRLYRVAMEPWIRVWCQILWRRLEPWNDRPRSKRRVSQLFTTSMIVGRTCTADSTRPAFERNLCPAIHSMRLLPKLLRFNMCSEPAQRVEQLKTAVLQILQQLIWCDLSSPGVRIHTLGFPRPYRYDGREAQGEAATTVNHTDIRGLVAA